MHYVADDSELVSYYSRLIAVEPAVATTGAETQSAHAHSLPVAQLIERTKREISERPRFNLNYEST